jgi:hypothetical protein
VASIGTRLLVGQREISDGSITNPKRRTYDSPTMGKNREAHIEIVFSVANQLTGVPHNLGKVPQTWTMVEKEGYGVTPGEPYTDTPKPFSRTHVAFRCPVAQTRVVIALR